MRKFYSRILLGLFVFSFSLVARSQVTVTSSSGTTTPTNYTTLKGAFDAINSGTHQGAISINVSGNTSETAPAVLNSSGAGSASYSAILIFPSADNVVISGAMPTGRGLVELNGADNVTIDGDNAGSAGVNRNLTFQNTAANTVTYTSCIRIALSTLITSADNNVIKNCNLLGSGTGRNISSVTSETTTWGVVVSGGASTATTSTAPSALTSATTTINGSMTAANLQINNNNIQTVSRGVAVNGSATTAAPGLVVSNNTIGNPVAGAADQVWGIGITVQGSTNAVVSGNTVYVEGWTSSSTTNKAIDFGTVSATGSGAIIENNIVGREYNNSTGGWAAYGINIAGGTNHIIRNNFITNVNEYVANGGLTTTFGAFGIRLAGGTGHKVYHNSVNMYGPVLGAGSYSSLAAFMISSTTITGVDVRNNIFSNTITGAPSSSNVSSIMLPSGATSAMNLTLNNNAYFQGTGTGAAIAQVGTTSGTGIYLAGNFNAATTTPATNLRAYTSTLSAAGTNDNASFALIGAAPFTSNSDLHIPNGTTTALESGGVSVGVTTDIDGQTRPGPTNTFGGGTSVDIGADEFDGAPLLCGYVSGITASAITSSGANLSWSATAGAAGYEWAVTTSSTPPASGTATPGTTATASGLAGNTTYYVHVRSSCGGTAFGPWSTISFTTLCNATTIPLTEGFNTAGVNILPSCWTQQYVVGTSDVTFQTSTSNPTTTPQEGTRFAFWNSFSITSGNETRLVSPPLNTTGVASVDVEFYLYNENNASYNAGNYLLEGVQVQYSTNGTTWTDAGTFFPRHDATLAAGTGQWKLKTVTIPGAGNQSVVYVAFKFHSSFGDNVSIDAATIKVSPPCTAPSPVTVGSVTNNAASVSFTSAGNNFIVEYGPSGFTPGTGASAGTGGTIVTGTASPIALSGLAANTTYNVYVRQVCAGPVYSANSAVASFTTLCNPTALPLTEGFNTSGTAIFPTCWTQQYVVGSSNITFQTNTTNPTTTPQEGSRFAYWNSFSITAGNETRLVSAPVNTTGASTVDVKFYFYNENNTTYSTGAYLNEGVQVQYSLNGGASWTDAGAFIPRHDASLAAGTGQWKVKTVTLPAAAGNQPNVLVGFKFHSEFGDNVSIDAVTIKKTPTVDVSPVAIVTPPTSCPINLATIQGTIKNMTTVPLDLAVNPVTVTATISGAGSATLTGTVNSGTLAPGATMNVILSPTFNFATGGTYNFVVTTTQATDEDVTNNSYSTSIVVNSPPAAPTVTPASPSVCAGSTQLLTASGSSSTGTATLTGTSPTTSTGSNTPFYRTFEGSRRQYLISASELTALGLSAGSQINSLSFNVTAVTTPVNLDNFNMKVGATTSTALTAFETGATTTVFTSPSYVPVLGANTFNFSTPFTWNGTSNVFVEICWDNDPNNTCSSGSPVCWGNTPTQSVATTSFTSVVYYYADNTTGPRTICSNTTTSGTSSIRPVMVIGYTASAAYTWAPTATLFTDAAGTTPYTGAASATVYAKPTTATTYTVTATSGYGCTSTGTVTVNITPVTAITTQPQSQIACTGGSVTLSVVASGAGLSYQWRKNGANIGTNSASLTLTNVQAADAGNYDVVVTGTCGTVTSSVAVLQVGDNTWTGTSNTDWNNPLNWCGGLPTAATNVLIPSGTPFSPTIAANAPVNNLAINSGATLTIAASGRLQISGNLTNNGTFNATAGTIEFRGAANQNVPAITAANIIMNGAGGITLGGNMNIGTALTLTNGNITLGNNNLTMVGGSAGTVASHIVTNGTGNVTASNVGVASVIFPVGPSATTYNPVMIANGQGRNYTVGVATGLPATPALANAARAVNRTWNITVNTAPTSPVNIALQYADADVNASGTGSANMEAGVSNGSSWLIATPAGGMAPVGTATARVLGFQTVTFGTTVLANVGGVNFPLAVPNVDADVTSIILMPNPVVDNNSVLRVNTRRTMKVQWSVIDASGRVVMSFDRQIFAGQNDIQLKLTGLAAGTYQLTGKTDKGKTTTVRFVRM